VRIISNATHKAAQSNAQLKRLTRVAELKSWRAEGRSPSRAAGVAAVGKHFQQSQTQTPWNSAT
jgi:hypothetical protein